MTFLVDASHRLTKHVRLSGDEALARSLTPTLEEAGDCIRRITPLLRRKAKSMHALDAIVKKASRAFASTHKQIWIAQQSIKATTRLLEKALECGDEGKSCRSECRWRPG